MLTHTKKKLQNGLSVLTIPMPGVESVTVLALCNTGSRFESKKEQGIAHFFEHMVFKGTESYPTAQLLARTIDSIGAEFNAFTSKEYTGYYVKAAGRHVGVAIDVVSDMLLKPFLRQADIDREKGVIVEEMNMYEDMPMRQVENIFERMIFADTSLGHDILGTKETVNSFTTADFKQFLSRWYGIENVLLILAGDPTVVNSPQTDTVVTKSFSKDGGDRESGKFDVSKISDTKGKWSKDKMHISYKKTEQAHLIMAWPGIARGDERRTAVLLADVIMGGNMSSRLFTEVREQRGLCYYVRSGVDFFHETGCVSASAGVAPKRIFEALEVIKDEFEQASSGKRPFTQEEFKNAKDYLIGSMILDFEDSRSVAQFYGVRELLLSETQDPSEVIERIKATTLEEVQSVFSQLVQKGEVRLAVVGPYKSAKEFEKFVE